MKKWILVLLGLCSFVAACGDIVDDGMYEDDRILIADTNGAAECLPHELYDAETDTCGVDIACTSEEECDAIISALYADDEYVELEYWEMLPEDCLPGEAYDESEGVCYIECDSDEDCAAKVDEIYQGVDVYYNEAFAGHPDKPDSRMTTSKAEGIPAQGEDNSGGLPAIARYELDENLELMLIQLDESVQEAYKNQERHQEIWHFLSRTLPKNILRDELREYHIFTDGGAGTLAYVTPLAYDNNRWLMGLDIEDSGTSGQLGGEIGLKEFIHTIVHEFAHIVTLEADQVPPTDVSAFDTEDALYEAAEKCQTFYTGEGCSLSKSYINLYFQRFWADIYPELADAVNVAQTEEEMSEIVADFYLKYADRFVSEYAATNPGEDIAEVFAFFVLKEKPTGNSIADEKVRFFYNFPQLVEIRTYIRSQLARID